MKRLQLFFVLLCVALTAPAQVVYEQISSEILGADRQLKIQLPRNYEKNAEKQYPLILIFDGDYLYEPVAGNVDYFSYWEDMPEAVVVGVIQNDRDTDSYYEDVNFLPAEGGAAFMDFIGAELLPMLEDKFRLAPFKMAVGHDLTANFISFDLLREDRMFQAYMALSPDYSPRMQERLLNIIPTIEKPVFYYLATGGSDISALREDILPFHQELKAMNNDHFTYYFDDFEGATHYSLAARAIPTALERLFAMYRPISKKEFKEEMLASTDSPYDYLTKKYETVYKLFQLENKIRVNDFNAAYAAIEKKEDWASLELLGKLARKTYPETMLGNYYLAYYHEQVGEPKRALKEYQNAFLLQEISFLTKDMMLERGDKIKADFGYR
ncbi:alpha/beta hydrolase [Croceiramulus getboli]|nr:alpha/beta hydrolase-fold protein [Flavobacteriaceae bacterium YJPT1-3]